MVESELLGLSSNGRYALVSEKDTAGGVTLRLLDFATGQDVIGVTTTIYQLPPEDTGALLRVGRLQLAAVDDSFTGSLSEVNARLAPYCGEAGLEAALGSAPEYDPGHSRLRYAVQRRSYVVVSLDNEASDDCDQTLGDVVVGFSCADAPDPTLAEDERLLASGGPAQVRARIASEIFKKRGDPLRALGLLRRLIGKNSQKTPRDVRLALYVDELSYLSRLGALGKLACRERAERIFALERPKDGRVSPSELSRFKQIERYRRQCLDPAPVGK